MTTPLKLIDALPDFGAAPRRTSQPTAAVVPPVEHMFPPPQNTDALIGAAVMEAEQALSRRLTSEHEARLAVEREVHANEIEAMARRFGREAGERVVERLAAFEQEVGAHASAAVARILGGLMSDDLRQRSVESLARALTAALSDQEAVRVEVRGPQSLFEEFAKQIEGRLANVVFIETAGFDLTVTLDETVFETRIGEWSRTLSGLLA